MIKFNIPYINKDFNIDYTKISGDGFYTKKLSELFVTTLNLSNVLMTTSCTHALELSALLLDIKEGDEIIAPSYTFVSTVSAFILRGAKVIFVDIDPLTMNINTSLIESAITKKTKAIVPVHYAGVSCDMDSIMSIAKKYNLYVVEDSAQALYSKYKGTYLGCIGHLGTVSFHETKNFTMGEGGALFMKNNTFVQRAEIIREKGTNRKQFLDGFIDKYTWVDLGSSFLPSDINVAYLYPQIIDSDKILQKRMQLWNQYYLGLSKGTHKNLIELPYIPEYATHNAHMFWIKAKDKSERSNLMNYLLDQGIETTFHYVPLHSSPAGKKFGTFHGIDRYTTLESERIIRLPLHHYLTPKDVQYVIDSIFDFFEKKLGKTI